MLKEAWKLYKKLKLKLKKKKTNTKADQLPLSLIESEILPRLPAKTVGRCMCVCQQWKSFLSTPKFARMHLHHVTINDCKHLTYDSYFRTPEYGFMILASLDGLLCVGSWYESAKLAFWNPLTGACKRLSANPIRPFRIDLGFDAIGFYMDHSSNDYKLLYLMMDRDYYAAYIYSNRLDSWRGIEFSVGSNIDCTWSQASFCGQCLYFIVTDRSMEGQHSWIICFEVKTEKFRTMKCPLVPDGATHICRSLVVLNGCIHLCVSYKILNTNQGSDDWWRMDGYGGRVKVAAFSKNEFIRSCIRTESIGNWLVVLEIDDSFKKMNTEDFTTQYWNFCSPTWWFSINQRLYVETLVSPNP